MEFGVLGPLTAIGRDGDRAPTAPKQRQMLALLLLNANRVVSMGQLIEELWEYSPPSSAVAAVHTYVMQLRRTLQGRQMGDGRDQGRVLTRDQGYLLEVRPGELDLDVFEDRVRMARSTLARGEIHTAAEQLRAALAMWRGQALVDVTPGPLLHPAVAAIERNRLDAVIQRAHADLLLGRHHELIGELSGLVHQHLANEELSAHLMLALYRSGRQADALAVYHRLADSLRKEVGALPTQRVRQLHMDILSAHARLEPREATRRAPLPGDPDPYGSGGVLLAV